MPIDIIVGLQWGDEGKGKIVDLLSPGYDIITRFQGGPNAGHTLVIGDKKYVFHCLPSGVIHSNIVNVLGSGMVIDPQTLKNEIDTLEKEGINIKEHILISRNAHLIIPAHKAVDRFREQLSKEKRIGSTLKGIGPSYEDKIGRRGIRIGDIFSSDFKSKYENLKRYHLQCINDKELPEMDENEWMNALEYLRKLKIIDTEDYLNKMNNKGVNILAEGAQGTLLDINFGTYPYVTSSNTVSGSACSGLGISPTKIRDVYGVFKAYTTRVGEGPFPSELSDETGTNLMKFGNEYGSTTGRPRRCGWLDIVALKYAVMLNGTTKLVITKPDVLSCVNKIQVCFDYQNKDGIKSDFTDSYFNEVNLFYKEFDSWTENLSLYNNYDNLPVNFKKYLSYLESELSQEINIVSVGADRSQTIFK